jgi:hypothetical protein
MLAMAEYCFDFLSIITIAGGGLVVSLYSSCGRKFTLHTASGVS